MSSDKEVVVREELNVVGERVASVRRTLLMNEERGRNVKGVMGERREDVRDVVAERVVFNCCKEKEIDDNFSNDWTRLAVLCRAPSRPKF
jgi:hypothetical protein